MPKLIDYLSRDDAREAELYLQGRLKWNDLELTTQQAIKVAHGMLGEADKKQMPFGKPVPREAILDQIGIEDGRETVEAFDNLNRLDVQNGLINRMGGDESLPDEPLSREDIIRASFEAHEGNQNG